MYSIRPIALLFLLPVLAAAEPLASRGKEAYEKKIQPLLVEYCFDCHADGVEKGNFTFDRHGDYAALRADMKFWDHVRQQVSLHVMPPDKKPAPSLEQRDEIVAWIDDAVFWFDPAKPDPGHVTTRRLNRTEYNNTVRDLLGVDSRPANAFPPDDSGYGYDNIGDVLSLSPMLMEKYLRAARAVASQAMTIAPPGHVSLEMGAKKFWNQKGETKEEENVRWFYGPAEAATKVQLPVAGHYTLIVRAAATRSGDEPAKFLLRVNGQEIGTYDVTTAWRDAVGPWQKVTLHLPLKAGENKITLSYINDHSDPNHPDPQLRDRNLVLSRVEMRGPHNLLTPNGSRFLRWLVGDRAVGRPAMQLTGEDFEQGEGNARIDVGGIMLGTRGYVKHPLEISQAGRYRLSFKAGAQQAGDEPAKFEVKLAGQTLGPYQVTAKNQAQQWFQVEADLPAGAHELQVWFLNDFYEPETNADRNFWLHQANVEGPLSTRFGIKAEEVPALVDKMAQRLFRRPLQEAEKLRWRNFADLALKEGEAPFGALRFTLEGLLVSPAFLFHTSPKPAGPVTDGTVAIDEFSLANRLAYFLWSAPPDDRLLELAARGELRKNLAAELKRMIADGRAGAFTDNFAGQWLQLRDMDIIAPDNNLFPEWFEQRLAGMMKRESQMFFDHILRENRSVLEFINADYSFMNDKLANFYGVPNVTGEKFQKVSLQGTPRGGIMTQGSILTLTSTQTRTSPVKRGKYLLENILGMPPPPAPGDVPPLDERKARSSKLTLREQFAEHRSNPSCAGCHAFLDPMGFVLENYDAIGRWREVEKKQPIDPSGQLARGQTFKDYVELREILVRDLSDSFLRNLAENLLTYALGRGIDYSDKPAVQGIVQRAKEKDMRFQEVLLAVCESVPFQRMRQADAASSN